MTKAEQRTIAGALKEFKLIAGPGAEQDKKACAMTLLSWVAGRPWPDHPPCAHKTLAGIVILANDANASTPATRASLVKAGEEGVLDTWWIPGVVIAWAQTRPKDKEMTPHQFAIYVLKRIAKWKAAKGLLSDLDLRGAYLRGAYLTGADLTGADLTGADLTGADLTGAYLRGADLTGADLTGADLRGADLTGAYLTGADLTGAYLTGAYLRGADLTGAYLTGAKYEPATGMPKGWKLNDSGLWVKA